MISRGRARSRNPAAHTRPAYLPSSNLSSTSRRIKLSTFYALILTSCDHLPCCSVWCQSRITRACGAWMQTFVALLFSLGGTVSAGIFVSFFIALKILTCYYQCREQRPWGRTGGAASGKGTCPCSGRCIVVMTARLPRAGNGGDARSIA